MLASAPRLDLRALIPLLTVAGVLPAAARELPQIAPEPPPRLAIAEFSFPEAEATLTSLVTTMTRRRATEQGADAERRVYRHGWGLWTMLTYYSQQAYRDQRLRVFETWLSLDELQSSTPASVPNQPSAASTPPRLPRNRSLRPLGTLRLQADDPAEVADVAPSDDGSHIARVIGFVKFDPSAAEHVVRQRLLDRAAMDALLDAGAIQVPPFPATALIAKPVFQIVKASELVGGRYHPLHVWSGPPAVPQAWGPDRWTDVVWIDVRNGGSGRGAVDAIAATDGSSRTPSTTYPVADFIHHPLSAADAAALNQAKPDTKAAAGDIALLVAMHVAGRELARWTWQTFWWTPAPDTPPAPSSVAIAAARLAELVDAPRHYAMSLSYAMLAPEQPYTGGSNEAPAVYAYNPWIEARFAPDDLPDSRPGLGPDGTVSANNVGVQTNCVSCHAQATHHAATLKTAPRFTGARYVDLIDPQYVGTLQTDFLWSLPRHAR